jgi:hypothetical protein
MALNIEVQELLEMLRAKSPVAEAATPSPGHLTIILEETGERQEFAAEDARLLLASRDTVERLFEALNWEETAIELCELTLEPGILEELEKYASVDEL